MHMHSWAFSDHICRKYQQAIYEIPWYQFIWGTAQVDFMFGFDWSLHGSVFDFRNDRTEYLRRIGDIGVKSASARRTFRKQILLLFKTCDVNAGFTLAT